MGYNDHLHDDDEVLDHEGLIHQTEDAKLYRIDGEKVWIPKSCLVDEADDTIVVKRWFAKKEGLV